MIVNFKSTVLKQLWVEGDITLLPSTYVYEVIEILTILDAPEIITDFELLDGFEINEYKPNNWAITVIMKSVVPIRNVTLLYSNGNAHDVDLNGFD